MLPVLQKTRSRRRTEDLPSNPEFSIHSRIPPYEHISDAMQIAFKCPVLSMIRPAQVLL